MPYAREVKRAELVANGRTEIAARVAGRFGRSTRVCGRQSRPDYADSFVALLVKHDGPIAWMMLSAMHLLTSVRNHGI